MFYVQGGGEFKYATYMVRFQTQLEPLCLLP